MSEVKQAAEERRTGSLNRKGRIGPVTSEALSRLAYLLERPLGCGVVSGPENSGKTGLMRALSTGCTRRGVLTAEVDGQGLDGRSLYWELAAGWRIGSVEERHGRRLAQDVRDYMHGAAAANMRLALILDHTDEMEHSAVLVLSRLLHEAEVHCGLTLIWSATSPLHGEAVDMLLPFSELRIDCPAPTTDEAVRVVRDQWKRPGDSDAGEFPPELEQRFAALSRGDLRRAERLARLSRLAAHAEGVPLSGDILDAVANELA